MLWLWDVGVFKGGERVRLFLVFFVVGMGEEEGCVLFEMRYVFF